MPETPQQFHARAKPLEPLTEPERPRHVEGGVGCTTCVPAVEGDAEAEVWPNERWRVILPGPGGSPLMLVAQPMAHHDLADLPDDLAAARAVIQALVASFGGRALGVAES